MNWVGACTLGGMLAAFVLAPRDARAMGAVIGPPDQPVAIAWARVAIAVGDGRTMRWAQVSVTSGPSGFAWLIPVEPGARIDLTTDAWLDALDAATVPVVLPPAFASSCEVALTPEITPSRATPSTLNPTLAHVAFDLPTLTAFVSASGFEIGSDLQKGLESTFAAGEAILMLTYAGGGSVPVRTLRVADTGPATLPFALTGSSSLGPIEVSAFTLAGSEEEAGLPPLVLPGGSILWLASGQSNYDDEVASLLASSGGTSWFNQSASPAVLFRPNAITPSLAVPSVLEDYYALASKYGDTLADPGACTIAAVATADEDASFATACPAGGLVVLAGPTPCLASPPTATSFGSLLCGPVADAALAVATLSPTGVWVTRMDGIVTRASAADVPLLSAGTTPETQRVVASDYGSGCGGEGSDSGGELGEGGFEDDGGGVGFEGGASFGGPSDGGGGSSCQGVGGGDGSYLSIASDTTSNTSEGCGSGTSGDGDSSGGCGGDSSSSDDSSEGCGTSSDDSSGCSSASAGDDSGCSGNNDCTTAKHGHRTRSPVSRVVLLAAAALGFARRRRRALLAG